MTTLHTEHPSSEELLRAIDHLEEAELRPFVSRVLARTARRLAPHLELQESELLERINRALPPESEQRYRKLIATRQAKELTPAELEELLCLTDQAERLQAERIQHLADLARLRGVSLTELMEELRIEPLPVE